MYIKHNAFLCHDIEAQLMDSEYLTQCFTCNQDKEKKKHLDIHLEGAIWEEGHRRQLRIMPSEMHAAGDFGEKPQRTGRDPK